MKKNKFLIVHGHFYQPPRENPWLGEIESQPSAAPDHDWNERILKQCYEPNGCSRVLDSEGRIVDMINNYAYMSFNFGPTLLNWIEAKHPDTYARIIQADKDSIKRLGHGNAIAQVFNHMIMPLANQRDRLTQIRWGVRDFERHFGRKPECIWLGETAINNETAADLIREGIRFVLLAPSQAGQVRPLEGGAWQDVSWSNIDGTQTYRIYPRDGAGRPLVDGYLDAFFYDDGLSRAVSFERILNDANTFANRARTAFDPNKSTDQVVTIATDGESYGHHHEYGDMCLAYLFDKLLPETEIEVTNPAAFLATHPPVMEVELKNGTGEGTAWSCAHGVGRWYRDCSCSTGAGEGWNQRWRTPLRQGLNRLRDDIDEQYEKAMSQLVKTGPWAVRDAYVELVGVPNDINVAQAFCAKHLKTINAANQTRMLKLLEMQKFMMYSFTSCGWFFNDIEGIEPMQNLKYACRVVDFARELFPNVDVETPFMRILREAQSNLNKRSGQELYLEQRRQDIPLEDRVIAASIFHAGFGTRSFRHDSGQWEVQCEINESTSRHILWNVELLDKTVLERSKRVVLTLRSRFHEDLVVVFPVGTSKANISVPSEIFPHRGDVVAHFSNGYVLAVSDLLPDHLQSILDEKAHSSFEAMCDDFREFPQRYNLFFDLIAQQTVDVPEWISTPIRLSLSAEINSGLRQLLEPTTNLQVLMDLIAALDHAKRLGVAVHVQWIQVEYARFLRKLLTQIVDGQGELASQSAHLLTLITAADKSGMNVNRTELENLALPLVTRVQKGEKVLRPVLEWLNFAI